MSAKVDRVLGMGVMGVMLIALPAVASPKIDWDRAENVKQAATRLGEIQRRQGASKAYEFILNCYKTHSLARSYTRYIEGCIAQDYIHTQTLALIYSRMPPAALKKSGMPSPQALAQAMGKRVSSAFGKYEVPVKEADAVKKLVELHGFKVFNQLVFPKPARGKAEDGAQDSNPQQPEQP
jgi:hypothetical protein